MKHPLLFLAVFFGLGVVLVEVFAVRQVGFWTALAVPAAVLFFLGKSVRRKRFVNVSGYLFLFASAVSMLSAGAVGALVSNAIDPGSIVRFTDARVAFSGTFCGRLYRFSVDRSGRIRYEIDLSTLSRTGTSVRVRGRVLYGFRIAVPPEGVAEPAEEVAHSEHGGKTGVVSARMDPPAAGSLHAGDDVCLSGAVRGFQRARNRGGFDEAAYYRSRGIMARVAGRPSSLPDRARQSALILKRHNHRGLFSAVERLRTFLRRRILQTHRSSSARSLLPALFLGDRSLVAPGEREAFRTSGLSHLLAISGLHVGILGMGFYWLFGLLLLKLPISLASRQKIRSGVTFLFLVLFALISGSSPSVQRATAMFSIFLLGAARSLRTQGWNALGAAALVVLVAAPHDLFSAGFQLSFAAVSGIFLVLGNEVGSQRKMSSLTGSVFSAIRVSAAATLSTMPVILYHFGSAPLLGLLLNVVAIPLTALLLFSALLSTVFVSVLPVVGDSLAGATDLLSSSLSIWAHLFSGQGAALSLHAGTGSLTAVLFLPVALLVLYARRRRGRVFVALLASGLVFVLVQAPDQSGLRISFLDVGQGDAAVVRTPDGSTLVVDTGAGPFAAGSIGSWLLSRNVRRIDALVVTHFHQDHAGGLVTLLRRFDVGYLVVPDTGEAARFLAATPELINGIRMREAGRGDTLLVDSSVRLQVLSPDPETALSGGNKSSVVLRLTYGETAFLLSGDAERAEEASLVVDYGESLRSNVIKVAHHGSDTSSSIPFINRAVQPGSWAVVSVGRENRFDHPSLEVIRRWQAAGAVVTATASSGEISFFSDGIIVRRENFRDP